MRIETLGTIISARLRTITTGAEVRSAAIALTDGDAGLVVVCGPAGEARGVISKSDLVRHLAATGSPGADAAGMMTREVFSCRPEDEVRAVWREMTARRLQNVPVLDPASKPVGILDIRDAMRAILDAELVEEQALADYIAGVGYR